MRNYALLYVKNVMFVILPETRNDGESAPLLLYPVNSVGGVISRRRHL